MHDFRMLIDGELVAGAATLDVLNPATEELVAKAPRADAGQFEAAVTAANSAFAAWSAKPVSERAAALLAMAERVEAHAEELGRLTTLEQGKPLAYAVGEARGVAAALRHAAGADLTPQVLEETDARRVEVHRLPLGVVAAIVPWNFPLALFGGKVAHALIAGNTVVAKPAPTTPLATLRIGELVRDLLPPGVLNIVTDANDLGHVLTAHPLVRRVSFTGSTATGRKVMASAADDLKRVTLELGGNDAAIVLDDADPRATAEGIFRAAFYNSGQVCIAVKRVYADDRVHDALVDELAVLARNSAVGDGLEQGTRFGPLQNRMQFERVRELLDDARETGRIVASGSAPEGKGYFIAPTIVADVTDGMRIVDEEQFGPVLPVVRVRDEEDALARANASPYGLGGSVWSSDPARAARIAARMETGTAWVNNHLELGADIPFGGAKQSGIGVENGVEGLHEFTQLHVVNIAL